MRRLIVIIETVLVDILTICVLFLVLTKRPKALLVISLSFIIGAVAMILAGFCLMEIAASFEAPAIFWGGIILALPSGLLGPLIAWLVIRRRATEAGQVTIPNNSVT